jgi:hypothetical protein
MPLEMPILNPANDPRSLVYTSISNAPRSTAATVLSMSLASLRDPSRLSGLNAHVTIQRNLCSTGLSMRLSESVIALGQPNKMPPCLHSCL